MLIDTHCHIHEADYPLDKDKVVERAKSAGVKQIICIGSDYEDSRLAVKLAEEYEGLFASIGIHPHHANQDQGEFFNYFNDQLPSRKIIAIGEIGLDYHYEDSPSPKKQIELLKNQIDLALRYDLPVIFHVREAYDDFWKVLDSYGSRAAKIKGVLHSFTDSAANLQKGLERGFYISVNGISTFTHDRTQKEMFKSIPLDKLLLETDAPWLTPYPLRGKIKVNEPVFVREVAEYIGKARDLSLDEVSKTTTANARTLFNLK